MNKKSKNMWSAIVVGVLVSVVGATSVSASSDTYAIKKGDTLYKIAKEHKVTVEELKKINKLKDNTIYTGKKLKVFQKITVKKGDTLYSLAKKNGTTVKQLKKNNGLTSNSIYAGKTLHLVGAEPIAPLKVTTVKGFKAVNTGQGTQVITLEKNNSYKVQIRVLGTHGNVVDLKKSSETLLKKVGKVQTPNKEKANAFYGKNVLHQYATSKNTEQHIVVKKVNGKLVQFTIHTPKGASSDATIKPLLDTLQKATF